MAKAALTRPKKLEQGDAVGVVAPAGPVDAVALKKGLDVVRGMGFKPVLGESINQRNGFLAGTDEERADDMMRMFSDPTIRGIFCARGGYGVNRILQLLQPKVIKANPKVVVGSSDVTLLLIYLMQKCSLMPFYGPMVAGSFGCHPMIRSKTQFRKMLTGATGAGSLSAPKGKTLRSGKARGKLTGGCLTLLCRSLKTPYEIQTDGHLLLIEDVSEPAYRIDGMLWQLKTAGKFKGVKGVVFGEMIQCHFAKGQSGRLEDVVMDVLKDESFPVLYNCPIGHGPEMWTLPLGVEATLDADAKTLEMKHNGVKG